jgi:hypothetical protein
MALLTANDLLAGSAQRHSVRIPAHLLPQAMEGDAEVLLRPLTVNDLQRVGKAAKDEGLLSSVLMVQQAVEEPAMSIDQVGNLPAGLMQFLLAEVNRTSGLSLSEDEMQQAVKAPLTKAVFVLAKEFGWTPAECSELTVGQVLLYLDLLAGESPSEEGAA